MEDETFREKRIGHTDTIPPFWSRNWLSHGIIYNRSSAAPCGRACIFACIYIAIVSMWGIFVLIVFPLHWLLLQVNLWKLAVFFVHHIFLIIVPIIGLHLQYFTILDKEGNWGGYPAMKISDDATSKKKGKKNKEETSLLSQFSSRKYVVAKLAIGTGTLMFFNLELPLGLLSHENVNFMLAPPPISGLQVVCIVLVCYLLEWVFESDNHPYEQGQWFHIKVMPLMYAAVLICRHFLTQSAHWASPKPAAA